MSQKFLNAYLTTALRSSTDEDGEPLDSLYSIDDLSSECVQSATNDCTDFLTGTMSADLREFLDNLTNEETQRAGHDFLLTRNGHGAGFWDGDWPEPQATMLTERAHAYGSVEMYVGDDGLIYSA